MKFDENYPKANMLLSEAIRVDDTKYEAYY